VIDTVGTAAFGLERLDMFVALIARGVVELERPRLKELVRLRTRDLTCRRRVGTVASGAEPLVLALRDMLVNSRQSPA